MSDYHFFIDIPVRWGDMDSFGHVNNAMYFTYLEQARFAYLDHLGIWIDDSCPEASVIVADAHVAFVAPIFSRQTVRVFTRVGKIGNKSFRVDHELREATTGELFATGDAVMVAYNYQASKSIPVPEGWRAKISALEGIPAYATS